MSSSGEYRLSLKVDGVSQATSDFKEFLDAINEGETKISSFSRALDQINVSSFSSDFSDFSGNIDDVVNSFDDLTNSASGISGTMDEISGSLSQIEQDASSARSSLDEVGSSFETVSSNAESAQSSFEGLASTTSELSSSMQTTQQDLDSLGPALGELATETDSAKQAVEELGTTFSSFDVEPAIGGITEFNTLTDTVVNTAQQAEDAINGLVGAASPLGSAFGAAADETEQFTGILANFNNQTEGVSGNIVQAGTSLENLGTQAETAGSKFSLTNNQLVTLAGGLTGLVGAGASVFSMWVQYEQAATRVDAANNKLEQSNIRVDSAQRKYNDAVAQFGASSPQAEEALRRLVLEQDKNAVAADRASQAQDRFALTMTNIATQALPTFLTAAGSAATVVGTLTDKGSSGVSMLDRLKSAFTGAGTGASGLGDAVGGATGLLGTFGTKMGTLTPILLAVGTAIAAITLAVNEYIKATGDLNEQNTVIKFQDMKTAMDDLNRSWLDLIDNNSILSNAIIATNKSIQQGIDDISGVTAATKDKSAADKEAAEAAEAHVTVLQKLVTANNDLNTKISETKDALSTTAGVQEMYRAGWLAIVDATTQLQVKTEEFKGSQGALLEQLKNGDLIISNYNKAYEETNTKYMQSLGSIGALAGEIKALNDEYEVGGRMMEQQIQGYANFNRELITMKDNANQTLGAFEGFLDAIQSREDTLTLLQKAFADGAKSAQDLFLELSTAEEKSRGFVTAAEAIAKVMNITIPDSAKTSEEALRRFLELLTEPVLDQIVRDWEAAGGEMISGIVEGMDSNQSKIDEQIGKIEEVLQRRLTDPEKWQIRVQMDAEELQRQLAEIEADIGRALTPQEKFKITVMAQTEDLTSDILEGINLAAKMAEGDPSAFVSAAQYHGQVMMQKIAQTLGQLSPAAAAQLQPLLDALTAPPRQGETIGDRVNWIATAMERLNPTLATAVTSLFPQLGTSTAGAVPGVDAIGNSIAGIKLKVEQIKAEVFQAGGPWEQIMNSLKGSTPALGGQAAPPDFTENFNKVYQILKLLGPAAQEAAGNMAAAFSAMVLPTEPFNQIYQILNVLGPAAAQAVGEMQQAFVSMQLNTEGFNTIYQILNLLGPAAAQAVGEIQTAFTSMVLPTEGFNTIYQILNLLGPAAAQAVGEIQTAFTSMVLPTEGFNQIYQILNLLGPAAAQAVGEIQTAFTSMQLPTTGFDTIYQILNLLGPAAAQAVGEIQQAFVSMQLNTQGFNQIYEILNILGPAAAQAVGEIQTAFASMQLSTAAFSPIYQALVDIINLAYRAGAAITASLGAGLQQGIPIGGPLQGSIGAGGQGFVGAAGGFGPMIVDHPLNMLVGESGAELVSVIPVNNNRNGRTGALSPLAPMRARFQGGTLSDFDVIGGKYVDYWRELYPGITDEQLLQMFGGGGNTGGGGNGLFGGLMPQAQGGFGGGEGFGVVPTPIGGGDIGSIPDGQQFDIQYASGDYGTAMWKDNVLQTVDANGQWGPIIDVNTGFPITRGGLQGGPSEPTPFPGGVGGGGAGTLPGGLGGAGGGGTLPGGLGGLGGGGFPDLGGLGGGGGSPPSMIPAGFYPGGIPQAIGGNPLPIGPGAYGGGAGGGAGQFGGFQIFIDQAQAAFTNIEQLAAQSGPKIVAALTGGLGNIGAGGTPGPITPANVGGGANHGPFQALVNQASEAVSTIESSFTSMSLQTSAFDTFYQILNLLGPAAAQAVGEVQQAFVSMQLNTEGFNTIYQILNLLGPAAAQAVGEMQTAFVSMELNTEGFNTIYQILNLLGPAAAQAVGEIQTAFVSMELNTEGFNIIYNILNLLGPAAAQAVGEIQTAFVSMELNTEGFNIIYQILNLLGPAAAQAVGEIQTAFTSMVLPTEGFNTIYQILNILGPAATQAVGEIQTAFTSMVLPTQGFDTIYQILNLLGPAAAQAVGEIQTAFTSMVLPTTGFDTIYQILELLGPAAAQAVGEMQQAFVSMQLSTQGFDTIYQVLELLGPATAQAVGEMQTAFTSMQLSTQGFNPIYEILTTLGPATQQAVGQMSQAFAQLDVSGALYQIQAVIQAAQAAAAAIASLSSMGGGFAPGQISPYGTYQGAYGPPNLGYYASGFGPQIVDHPMNLTVGESGAEMVFVAPMNNNRNSRTGELSPFAPMRARFQGGTAGGMFPAGGGGMGPGGGIGESFAWMFYQMAEAAMMAGKVTERSMGHITTAVQEQAIPQVEQLGSTFETTGKTSTNALEQIGHMILNGVIPPIEGVGIATIDASNLVGNSTQQMTNSFGHTGSYLQGSFIPLIGQQIPTAGNTAAQGLGQATGNISNSFGSLGSYLNNQFTPTINPAIPNAGNTAAQGIGSASANMQSSFNAANQTVQGLLGSINQIPAAAQQAAGALQGLGAAGGGLGGGLGFGYGTPADYGLTGGFGYGTPADYGLTGGFGYGTPADYGLTGGFGYGTPADYGLTGGFGYGTPADYGLTGGFGYGDPWAGLGAPTFGLAGGLAPMIFHRPTRLTVGESGKELVYRARLQGGTIPAGWNDPNNPLLLLGKKLIAENKPNPTEPFWYTGGTPGGGLASYFPQQQYFPQPGAAIGGPIAGFPTQGGLTQFGQNLPQTPAGTATPEFKAAMQAWLGGTFPTYGLGGTGGTGGTGNTFLGSQPATYRGAQGYTPLPPSGAAGGTDLLDMFLQLMIEEGEPGMFRFPTMRLQGGTFAPFGSLQDTGSLSGFPTQGGLTSFGQSLFGGAGGGYPQQQPTYGGGTYLGQQPAYYGGAQGYQPYPQQQPTGYTGGGFGIGDPWAGVPMPNAGFGIGNPWAGIPSPFPYGGFGPGGYWPGTGQGFPMYPGGPSPTYPTTPPYTPPYTPPTTPPYTPPPVTPPPPAAPPPPPPPPIYSLAPGPGTPRYYPAFRGGEDITSEFFDLSDELPALEAGLLNSIGSFVGISGVANTGGGTGGGGGGGTGGGGGGTGGGGGGGGPGHHRREDMIREIRRRIERAMGRAGMGSNVLLGRGGMESRMEARLAKIAQILENMTINLTVRNEIDGRAISDAMTKHQVRRLQTFV